MWVLPRAEIEREIPARRVRLGNASNWNREVGKRWGRAHFYPGRRQLESCSAGTLGNGTKHISEFPHLERYRSWGYSLTPVSNSQLALLVPGLVAAPLGDTAGFEG